MDESRRTFMKNFSGAVAGLTMLPETGMIPFTQGPTEASIYVQAQFMESSKKSIIGKYGPWAASLRPSPATLSFRNKKWTQVKDWQKTAKARAHEFIASPPQGDLPAVRVDKKYVFEGLSVEEISWQLPYGNRTKAIVLKPMGVQGRLPAVLALHDHGGNKYFGVRKITKTSADQHPMMTEHQEGYYGGLAWANEIAKKGYVVMVHDTFTFGSRRVLYNEVEGITWGPCNVENKSDADPEKQDHINAYNQWAGEHEHIMSKSLFCGGTTWPGVFLAEDQTALSILEARNDVDKDRIGCGGLSGGGLRTVFLAGLDDRIKCAVCVGFMSTWDDFLLHKAYTHTWMTYVPVLPNYLEFPEILGLRVPLPTLVMNTNQDQLYTLPEMKKADRILQEVYEKAGAADRYKAAYYEGPHKFDRPMQQEAFAWFDQWLK